MAFLALLVTAALGFVGWRIWKDRKLAKSWWKEARIKPPKPLETEDDEP